MKTNFSNFVRGASPARAATFTAREFKTPGNSFQRGSSTPEHAPNKGEMGGLIPSPRTSSGRVGKPGPSRAPHKHEIAGSNPAPATNSWAIQWRTHQRRRAYAPCQVARSTRGVALLFCQCAASARPASTEYCSYLRAFGTLATNLPVGRNREAGGVGLLNLYCHWQSLSRRLPERLCASLLLRSHPVI